LVDYYIDAHVIESLLKLNGLRPDAINVIEADVFLYEPLEHYDLVCSIGLIEHFTDLEQILFAHLKFMKPGGQLFVALPNFRGINGLLQNIFDTHNLSLHNLLIMDLRLLENACHALGLEDVNVQYYPSTQVWLENLKNRGLFVNLVVRLVGKLALLSSKVFGSKNRWLSNSIVITARKPIDG
jgi:SAM-dependent methyltransferase